MLFYTYLSFIEQDIRYDVWQTPCNNEDRILVCIGQLTNLEKDTKIKTKTDHWHSLPYMKLNNYLIMVLGSVKETSLIHVQISKRCNTFCWFICLFFHFLFFFVAKRGGGGGDSNIKVTGIGDASREIQIKPLRETNAGLVQA